MSRYDVGRIVVKMFASLLGGGLAHFAWLAVFLSTLTLDGVAWRATLWLLAPVVTAVGFAAGAGLFERLTDTVSARFLELYCWALVGCVLGASAVYWYGPMLIVFTMLVSGTASIGLQGFRAQRRDDVGSALRS